MRERYEAFSIYTNMFNIFKKTPVIILIVS